MVKTKEYLKSRFETGDIPTGEDYEALLDSYWHRTELGRVADGDAQPVSGGAVYRAMRELLTMEALRPLLKELLAEMLPELLNDYVRTDTLNEALRNRPTTAWVNQQLASRVATADLNSRLAEKADREAFERATTDLNTALEDRVLKTDLENALERKVSLEDITDDKLQPRVEAILAKGDYATKRDLPDISGLATKSELPDTRGLASKADLTALRSEVNTALIAKASQADVETAKNEAISAAAENTTNICALPTDFDANGRYIKTLS